MKIAKTDDVIIFTLIEIIELIWTPFVLVAWHLVDVSQPQSTDVLSLATTHPS